MAALNRVSLAGLYVHDFEALGIVDLEQIQKGTTRIPLHEQEPF